MSDNPIQLPNCNFYQEDPPDRYTGEEDMIVTLIKEEKMGCIYENFEGECELWSEDIDRNGCDEDGICICSEDPDPSKSCEDYESNWVCNECGADLNIEECKCEDD